MPDVPTRVQKRQCDGDTELMLRVGREETAAFEELYGRYRGRVYGQLFAVLRDHHLAEDLCQEVFLRIFRQRRSFEPRARFSTWLFCIARRLGMNAVRDRRRLRRRLTCASDLSASATWALDRHTCCHRGTPEQCLFRQERQARVSAALSRLPGRQRAAIVLQQFQRLGYHEIAQQLEITPTTVQALLRRARRHLRRHLACDAVIS